LVSIENLAMVAYMRKHFHYQFENWPISTM